MPHRYRRQLESTPWFGGLPLPLQDDLMACTVVQRLDKGEALYRCGDRSCSLYALLEGALEVGMVDVDGRETLLAVLGPTAWVGEVSLFDQLPRAQNVVAASAALLLQFPEAALRGLLSDTPQYWHDFALLMAQRLRVAYRSTEALSAPSAAQRLASRLLMIAEGNGGLNERQGTILISQNNLASMVSLSRQTTNQLLKELERQEIVRLQFGKVTILDIARLRAVAQGDQNTA
ncbi:Crp/Fnr family transcriptional regulator [Paraburkholderia sp. J67]|uniref:Crp/Fnr family transcriptional regulator n=1 Tax=Paraburkholderia sp. J67 TaxID=2805435 RepID=UPI0039F4F044